EMASVMRGHQGQQGVTEQTSAERGSYKSLARNGESAGYHEEPGSRKGGRGDGGDKDRTEGGVLNGIANLVQALGPDLFLNPQSLHFFAHAIHEKRANQRAGRAHERVIPPELGIAYGQPGSEQVKAAEGGNDGAVQHGQRHQSNAAKMPYQAERGRGQG